MEKIPTTQQALNALRSQTENSPILPIITPLFETLEYDDQFYPDTVSEHAEYTQLLWKTGELRSGNFEQISLTLAKKTLNMAIALDHRHNNAAADIPAIHGSALNTRSRSSMVIDSSSHILYETNPTNGVLVGTYYEQEAIERFTPELTHALAVMGLYGYSQQIQREVS